MLVSAVASFEAALQSARAQPSRVGRVSKRLAASSRRPCGNWGSRGSAFGRWLHCTGERPGHQGMFVSFNIWGRGSFLYP